MQFCLLRFLSMAKILYRAFICIVDMYPKTITNIQVFNEWVLLSELLIDYCDYRVYVSIIVSINKESKC